MVYVFSCCAAKSFISSSGTFSSVAIWSIKAPVPPAQEPFILTSMPPERKRIFASSPPSSMITSVPGIKVFAATRVAYTSWIKSSPQLSATPMPAEPESATSALSLPDLFSTVFKISAIFCVICE